MVVGAQPVLRGSTKFPAPKDKGFQRDLVRLNKLQASGHHDRVGREAAKLLKLKPDNPQLLLLSGNAARALGKPKLGLDWARKTARIDPTNEAAALLAAECLFDLGQRSEAAASLQEYLAERESWPVRHALALKLITLRRHSAALDVLQAGLSANANAQMLEMIGSCFQELGRLDEAIQAFELGMKLDPSHKPNFLSRAQLAQTYEKADPRIYHLQALQADPGDVYAATHFLWSSLARCDWDAFDKLAPPKIEGLAKDENAASPWFFLPLMDDPGAGLRLQRLRQKTRLNHLGLKQPTRAPRPATAHNGRIRLGYFSNDFYDHATLRLFSGVLRHHDHDRFEIHCFDFGVNDHLSPENLAKFDRVHAVQKFSDAEITALSRSLNLDIAVDLKGDTAGGRSDLFLLGQAPLQINYLGYPGTMGSRAYDYIIADGVVIPRDAEAHFDERILRLPTCYLPCDDRRLADLPPTRTELGLPEDAVVLACLNDPYKISREVFEIWLTTLKAEPSAVLWLWDGNEDSRANLVAGAEARGVAKDRLIFAARVAHQDHITRLAQADLYLDTFNCSAHTLAAEAVCAAGVPLLTKAGKQFAARVGASFITAAGLPELVCNTSAVYQAKLIELVRNRAELRRLRGQIAINRAHQPLFSSAAYTRFLEDGLSLAHQRVQEGRTPKSFDVPVDAPKGVAA